MHTHSGRRVLDGCKRLKITPLPLQKRNYLLVAFSVHMRIPSSDFNVPPFSWRVSLILLIYLFVCLFLARISLLHILQLSVTKV